MKDAFIAGLIGAVIGGGISAVVGYVAPVPETSVVNALGNGASGLFSGFFGGFMALFMDRRKRAARAG